MAKFQPDNWEIVRPLREGGQCWTYLVKRKNSDDDVEYVLKRLKNPERIGRFATEIEATTKLSHAGIVRIVDSSLKSDSPFLVTEYCHGGSLADCGPYWRSDPVTALAIFEQILESVHYAHCNGVLHRDLKPDNIFLKSTKGPPVVGDFGLSLLLDSDTRHTDTLEAVGPRLYMAPELENGRIDNVTKASDIYSLGKVLYWLLAGRVFSREAHRERQWDIKQHFQDPFSTEGDSSLEHVNFILDLMLDIDPSERRDGSNLLILIRQAQALIRQKFHYPSLAVRHHCIFCGRGSYKLHIDNDPQKARAMGLTSTAASSWRMMLCNECGHVQLFNFLGSEGWK